MVKCTGPRLSGRCQWTVDQLSGTLCLATLSSYCIWQKAGQQSCPDPQALTLQPRHAAKPLSDSFAQSGISCTHATRAHRFTLALSQSTPATP
jgi:hypothetical protein